MGKNFVSADQGSKNRTIAYRREAPRLAHGEDCRYVVDICRTHIFIEFETNNIEAQIGTRTYAKRENLETRCRRGRAVRLQDPRPIEHHVNVSISRPTRARLIVPSSPPTMQSSTVACDRG